MMIMQQTTPSARIEQLRKSVNDQIYMRAAVHRIAHVLSSKLVDMSRREGSSNERQRKRGGF